MRKNLVLGHCWGATNADGHKLDYLSAHEIGVTGEGQSSASFGRLIIHGCGKHFAPAISRLVNFF